MPFRAITTSVSWSPTGYWEAVPTTVVWVEAIVMSGGAELQLVRESRFQSSGFGQVDIQRALAMSVAPTAGNDEAPIGFITRPQSRKLTMNVVVQCNGRELRRLTHLAQVRLHLFASSTSMKLGFWAGRHARNGRQGPNLEDGRWRLEEGELDPEPRVGISLAYLNTRRRTASPGVLLRRVM